ncbi:4'-phosphopantetheinyl transferase family protein [Cardinium endosymbiont of Tipula unca]|uniref:4'-phosphopantetheinyl transferase family protein n=1 Tax=Cardinium endosymbiont of Tipula unca TaxID=3066216 RepID=UPI0030D12938
MSVYSFYTPSPTSFVLLWRIEASSAILKAQLNPLFADHFDDCSISSNEKIRQSLSVRLALDALLKRLGLPIVALLKDARGRPFLKNSNLYISFSHTHYFASVALSTSFPIGIDIEMIRPKLAVVQEKVLTNKEAEHADSCLEKLAIYWCAKEALYKLLDNQEGYKFKKIFIEPFQLQTEGYVLAHLNKKKYVMHYKRIACGPDELPHFCLCCEDQA